MNFKEWFETEGESYIKYECAEALMSRAWDAALKEKESYPKRVYIVEPYENEHVTQNYYQVIECETNKTVFECLSNYRALEWTYENGYRLA